MKLYKWFAIMLLTVILWSPIDVKAHYGDSSSGMYSRRAPDYSNQSLIDAIIRERMARRRLETRLRNRRVARGKVVKRKAIRRKARRVSALENIIPKLNVNADLPRTNKIV